jgi:hypothetical protein
MHRILIWPESWNAGYQISGLTPRLLIKFVIPVAEKPGFDDSCFYLLTNLEHFTSRHVLMDTGRYLAMVTGIYLALSIRYPSS